MMLNCPTDFILTSNCCSELDRTDEKPLNMSSLCFVTFQMTEAIEDQQKIDAEGLTMSLPEINSRAWYVSKLHPLTYLPCQ